MKRSSGGSPCRSSPRRRHSSCCLSIPAFECPEASFVLCASLVRQFEFAQHVWINDPNFHELGNERDPIIGNQDGIFDVTIPRRPVRKKITGLPAFTTVTGGAYFFLPGVKALRYLSLLRDGT
jgi:hypothetical protein